MSDKKILFWQLGAGGDFLFAIKSLFEKGEAFVSDAGKWGYSLPSVRSVFGDDEDAEGKVKIEDIIDSDVIKYFGLHHYHIERKFDTSPYATLWIDSTDIMSSIFCKKMYEIKCTNLVDEIHHTEFDPPHHATVIDYMDLFVHNKIETAETVKKFLDIDVGMPLFIDILKEYSEINKQVFNLRHMPINQDRVTRIKNVDDIFEVKFKISDSRKNKNVN